MIVILEKVKVFKFLSGKICRVKAQYEAKHKTMSKFVRNRLVNNTIVEQSNGESALLFWEKEIDENGLYIFFILLTIITVKNNVNHSESYSIRIRLFFP